MVSCIDYYVKKTIKLGIYMYIFILYMYVYVMSKHPTCVYIKTLHNLKCCTMISLASLTQARCSAMKAGDLK